MSSVIGPMSSYFDMEQSGMACGNAITWSGPTYCEGETGGA